MLQNVSGRDIHMRTYVVYGAQNVITKSTVNQPMGMAIQGGTNEYKQRTTKQ